MTKEYWTKERKKGLFYMICTAIGGILFIAFWVNFVIYSVNFRYDYKEILESEGIVLNANDNQIRIEVDGKAYDIETQSNEIVFALATYEDWDNRVNENQMNYKGSITGTRFNIYSGNDLVYDLVGYRTINFKIYEKDNVIIFSQTNDVSIDNTFAWE